MTAFPLFYIRGARKMSLEQRCKEGTIGIKELFEFVVGRRAWRTHLLDPGDYVVLPPIFNEDPLAIEEIAELDYLEKGDFITKKGTTGPINNNIYIKITNEGSLQYTLIEGDRVNAESGGVYELINEYIKKLS